MGNVEAFWQRGHAQSQASIRTQSFSYCLENIWILASALPAHAGGTEGVKFLIILSKILVNPIKDCETVQPLRVGDNMQVPFLTLKIQAWEVSKKCKLIWSLSFVFTYASKFSKCSAVPWTFKPSSLVSANQRAPRFVSAAAITMIPITSSHFNGLLVSVGKSYPTCSQLPAPRESTVFLPHFKESCSSVVTFESFHYLSAGISGAHSGLLTCPCLTALLTFGCLCSANQAVAEMCIVPLKSFWFSQVPLQFFDGTYGNVMSIWKSLCIICLYNCSLSQDKNSFLLLPICWLKKLSSLCILVLYLDTLHV